MASTNNISTLLEWMKYTHSRCILKSTLPQCMETEADGTFGDEVDTEASKRMNETISYLEIGMTVISILIRAIAVLLNIKLAVDYYQQGEQSYCIWTVVCMVVPMCVTALIYATMCYQDKKFDGGFKKATKTALLVIVASLFLRYWNTLIYSLKCKRAELQGDRDEQSDYYNRTTKEESDIALIRLFECFMETAPQKILQISIILMQENQITATQILSVLLYLSSVPWTLFSYNRCIRAAQPNKNKLSYWNMAPHLCWHFCISLSRIFCMAFVAVLFPVWTIVACVLHAVILGFVTYIVERPEFTSIISINNFLFCIALGFIYIFIYIPVKEAPTRYKYALYYLICSIENIICVGLFIYYPPNNLLESISLFYTICVLAIVFYYVGICCMLIYYVNYHPNVNTKRNKNTNG
ncbi:XK-related protein 6 [Bactrocera neohumeralis]|uniref:XK-related protein 6 n=1 Tax=Bactrocera tryoni TaxID=59916 RepID=UPI001A983313|nr:XK-related protein 6 [Bactrocera tryoni]XP_050328748.1 XK-related protein 6 [Bactrocera neohumeralis]